MNHWFQIASIQMDIIWENKKENFKKLLPILEKCREKDLIVLPETFATGFTMRSKEFCEPLFGETEEFLSNSAKKTNAMVGGGWMERNPDGNPYNTFSLYTPEGEVFRYRKIHPFSYAGEHKYFSSGSKSLNFSFRGIQISPVVCYDLRFPELFRQNVGNTDLYLVIANWPSPRVHHWLTLLKARAIENQAYVLGTNRVGVAGKMKKLYHNGYSGFFSPVGSETILTHEKEDILEVCLNLDELKRVREEFPYLRDIRGTETNFG